MKKILILLCATFCFLLISNSRTFAQCAIQSAHSASCNAYNGNAYQQTYYITSGVPVTINTYFYINSTMYTTGAEADLGSSMWFYTASSVGANYGGTTFTAAENDGFLYLALGSPNDGTGQITASW
jgi:hypothetical protein